MKFKIETLTSFTVMPNYHLQDKKLSLKAKGLLSTFFYLPNEWDYTVKGLCKITNTGITSIRSILMELELKGYLTREQYKDEKGKFCYTYIIRIKPKKIKPIGNTIALKRLKTALKNKEKNDSRV